MSVLTFPGYFWFSAPWLVFLRRHCRKSQFCVAIWGQSNLLPIAAQDRSGKEIHQGLCIDDPCDYFVRAIGQLDGPGSMFLTRNHSKYLEGCVFCLARNAPFLRSIIEDCQSFMHKLILHVQVLLGLKVDLNRLAKVESSPCVRYKLLSDGGFERQESKDVIERNGQCFVG